MNNETIQKKSKVFTPYISFSAFFLFACGSWGTVNSFWPVYFNSFGYSNAQIGVLSAVGPFAALFGLIFWGTRADRARHRNNIMLLICAILAVFSQLYRLNGSFFYTFAISVVFMFCFYSLNPIGDSMMLEYAQTGAADYGKARMWGSVGLAAVPLIPGIVIARWGISSVFTSFLILTVIVIVVALLLPKMAGGQRAGKKKLNLLALRSDKELVGLVCFLFPLHMTLGFYYSFFPIHMEDLGAANLIGLNNLAQFGVEFFMMFFLVRLVKRFGFARLYTLAFVLTAARMLFIGFISSPALLIGANLMCGVGYGLCMAQFSLFVLRTPKELHTSAQMLNTIVAHSLSRFLGSLIGGALADVIGIPSVFLCAGIFDVLLLSGFIIWRLRTGSLRAPVEM
jgi:PPP family 3-phenylpropionic acid transporter